MTKTDLTTDGLFLIPRAVEKSTGALACRVEIAHTMSEVLKGQDRYKVAAEMSQVLKREVSKHMLDAFTAESREDHTPPLDTAIAFDLVTGGYALLDLAASKLGARVVIGKETLHTQLGKLETEREETTNKIRSLKAALGDAE